MYTSFHFHKLRFSGHSTPQWSGVNQKPLASEDDIFKVLVVKSTFKIVLISTMEINQEAFIFKKQQKMEHLLHNVAVLISTEKG